MSVGKLVVLGASGHGKVVADAAILEGWDVLGFLDRRVEIGDCGGRQVLGDEDCIVELLAADPSICVIVAIGDNAVRQAAVGRLLASARSIRFASVRHPAATIASDATVGRGSIVMAGAVINPGVRVGEHAIVNTGALVDHDCQLGDFSTVSPGATLGGNVKLGERSVVGLGASMIHGLKLGADSILGAGAVATESIPDRVVAYGVPSRIVRGREPQEPYL